MSFIYEDDDLLSVLLKSAQVVDDARVNAEFKAYLDMSNKLVDSLRTKFSPRENQVASATPANMGVANMNSLGNFLDFTVQNGVTVGGQRVAYNAGENPPDLKNWLPVNAEKSSGLVESMDLEGHRKAMEGEYYVNKELLKKYITSLTADAAKEDAETQKMMKALLGGIIDKVNKILGTKLTTDYKEPEKKMDNKEVLTTFPETLDPKLYTQDGPKTLTWGDIQSADAIKAWVNNNNISIKVEGREGGPLGVNDPEFDFCVVARTIYGKATKLKASKPDPDKKYESFVKKIVEAASGLQGPNGKACSLGGASSSVTPPNAANINAKIQALFTTLPYSRDAIDFSRIERFFAGIEPLMTAVPECGTYIDQVRQCIAKVTPMLKGAQTFPLGMQPRQFVNMLNTDTTTTADKLYLPTLNLLDQILDGTRTVFETFKSKYGPQLEYYKSYIVGQIGERPTDNSLYYQNSNSIEGLRKAGNYQLKPGGK